MDAAHAAVALGALACSRRSCCRWWAGIRARRIHHPRAVYLRAGHGNRRQFRAAVPHAAHDARDPGHQDRGGRNRGAARRVADHALGGAGRRLDDQPAVHAECGDRHRAGVAAPEPAGP